MNNKEELEKRIENAEKELKEMKALLTEPVWKPEDIKPGLCVSNITVGYVIVIGEYDIEKGFRLSGHCGNPFQMWSDKPRSKKRNGKIFQ